MAAQRETQQSFRIEQPRLLLVEGTDDYWFFRRIMERREREGRKSEGIQVVPYGGKDNFGNFLASTLIPRLISSDLVEAIGVTRDADMDYTRAFQSISGSLRTVGLPSPSLPLTFEPGMFDGDAIQVVAYIMPDNASPGELETLCLQAVSNSTVIPCVDRFHECLVSIGHSSGEAYKTRLGAFLSANPNNPNLLIGQAIEAGVIPWDSPAFAGIHQLLDMLAAVD